MTTATAPTTGSATGTYAIDPTHSRLGFVARHAMVAKVRGSFNDFEGSGHFDAEAPERSSLRVRIQADSIDTRNADRDAHLRSGDFFDVDNHPTLDFQSTEIVAVDDTNFRITGDLTIKGKSHPVTFDVELAGTAVDPWGNTRIGLEGSAVVNRKDWDLTWNTPLDAGGVLVSDKITLELEVSAVAASGD